jgi:hypothetical protein
MGSRSCKVFFPLQAGGLALALAACGPLTAVRERLEPDVTPPVLLRLRTLSESQLELAFDEPVRCQVEDVEILPPCPVTTVTAEDCLLLLEIPGQVPGLAYHLEATVEDPQGNALQFLALFYGFNARVPRLLINELTVRGSDTHPDVVELKALSGGNMGGVVIYEGTPSSYGDRLVFPAFEVASGEFLLLHFRPQGIAGEVDELENPASSGGLDSSEQAWDFWVPAGDGLPGNNGVVSLYERPGGEILDGFLYSNRTSESDALYLGFGTREAMERALELAADGGWSVAGETVRPEDAVNPEGSTATRSLCRDRAGTDTDSAADWHIVPTSGFSFGEQNSEEVYQP